MLSPDVVIDLVLVHHDKVATKKLDRIILIYEFGFVEISLDELVRHVGRVRYVAQVSGDVQVGRLFFVLTEPEHAFLKH